MTTDPNENAEVFQKVAKTVLKCISSATRKSAEEKSNAQDDETLTELEKELNS